MFVSVDVGEVYAKERIREPAWGSRVRKIGVDDQHGEEREQHAVPELVETAECVEGVDYSVVVWVEEGAVLLKHGLVRVVACPGGGCCAMG